MIEVECSGSRVPCKTLDEARDYMIALATNGLASQLYYEGRLCVDMPAK